MTQPEIIISEVGPRDGLQSIARTLPTGAKQRWIRALAAAGLREIEVGSFVNPKRLPQMADTAEIVADAITLPGLSVIALVPNLVGAERAFAAGAHRVSMPVSVSDSHSRQNINRSSEEAIAEVRAVTALRNSLPDAADRGVEVGLSTAFGCTIEGPVAEDRVIRLAVLAAEAGADSVGLSDTTGMGNPAQVKRLFTRLRSELGAKAGGAHLHNTRGQGLANVVAALEAGVTTFDSSLAGLGGCPYAPGATGNIVTEDLVFMLEASGLTTGIDIDRLVGARAILAEALPGEPLYGHVAEAGLPKGFLYAGDRA
ncbi:MAG: hydroxymethylglutaryl-CoA lyase [Beijerinckiaceae bacterium]|nr:hydroxymethylglutaryl-CoA lyase [Beijerinckiaceae bacterium]MCZ8301767.1 hydroxymethylglutaryl-CoA lyase [Beijerinckiaceae bacterium]